MDVKGMWAVLNKRFTIPEDQQWILDGDNVQALYAVIRTLDVDGTVTEVPLFTVLRMASLFDVDLSEDELERNISFLVGVGLLSLRIGSYGTEMLSLSDIVKPI